MGDTLETVYMCGRELLQGCWLRVAPNIVFQQMAAPVSEIMDTSGIQDINKDDIILFLGRGL
jgi:hypothetical protein